MLIAVAIAAAVAGGPIGPDFSHAYVVWVASDHGRCNYFLTDVGENAQQLTQTLQENYYLSKGLEVLTSNSSPRGCAAKAL